jgi:hypothetical protein
MIRKPNEIEESDKEEIASCCLAKKETSVDIWPSGVAMHLEEMRKSETAVR